MLSLFAFIPASILLHIVAQTVAQPSGLGWGTAFDLILCSGLLYFFGLLAFRAFTGRGRKGDGGLLPPWAMVGAIHTFGVIGALIGIFGIWQRDLLPVLGGIAYLVAAYSTLLVVRARGKKDEESA